MVVIKYIITLLLLGLFGYIAVKNVIGIVKKVKEKRQQKEIDVVIAKSEKTGEDK